MIDYAIIPPTTIETLKAWIETGRPMGHFCEAVVSNDLLEACRRADVPNRRALFEIVAWLNEYAPIGAWGYPEALKAWPKVLRGEELEQKL